MELEEIRDELEKLGLFELRGLGTEGYTLVERRSGKEVAEITDNYVKVFKTEIKGAAPLRLLIKLKESIRRNKLVYVGGRVI